MRTALCMLSFFAFAAIAASDDPPAITPMTSEQIAQVRTLVRKTQTEQTQLKESLAKQQEKLAECYSTFDLDDKRIDDVHGAITTLQHKLLQSHYLMQKELRLIVGAERFKVLIRRIEVAIGNPAVPAVK